MLGIEIQASGTRATKESVSFGSPLPINSPRRGRYCVDCGGGCGGGRLGRAFVGAGTNHPDTSRSSSTVLTQRDGPLGYIGGRAAAGAGGLEAADVGAARAGWSGKALDTAVAACRGIGRKLDWARSDAGCPVWAGPGGTARSEKGQQVAARWNRWMLVCSVAMALPHLGCASSWLAILCELIVVVQSRRWDPDEGAQSAK